MKLSNPKENLYLLLIVAILTGTLLSLIYFSPQNIFLDAIKSILSLLFMFFLPGYILTHLLLRNKLDRTETFVLSVGLSVCITIFMGMIVHLAQMKINFFNIMCSILVVSLILLFFVIFVILKDRKIPSRKKWKSKISRNDKLFFFCLFLLLFVMSIMTYISITLPSEEEFVELYWKVSELKDLANKTDVNCSIDNCGLSGIYKIGTVDLVDNSYKAIITDLNYEGMYDSICIDVNQNEIFCEENEGPFARRDSFGINSNSFNVIYFRNNQAFIANYPREVYVSNFTVGFVIKSNYNEVKNFNMGLFVNETLQHSENLTVEPHQEISNYYSVYLPENGLYRVKVAVLPLTLEEKTYIEFWVEKNT